MDVQLVLPGFEELVVPQYPDLDEMLEYLDDIGLEKPQPLLAKVFGLTQVESNQVVEYWRALPKERKDD